MTLRVLPPVGQYLKAQCGMDVCSNRSNISVPRQRARHSVGAQWMKVQNAHVFVVRHAILREFLSC